MPKMVIIAIFNFQMKKNIWIKLILKLEVDLVSWIHIRSWEMGKFSSKFKKP